MTQTGNTSVDLALGLLKTFAFPGTAVMITGILYKIFEKRG